MGTFVFVMACVCGLAACLLNNHHHIKQHPRDHYVENLASSASDSWNNFSADEQLLSINVTTFASPLTYANLYKAGLHFSPDAIIGHGGFGDVLFTRPLCRTEK